MGGVPEVITSLAEGMSPRHRSSVLVARSRGWGRQYVWNGVPIEATTSLGTVVSMPISPNFPLLLARRLRTTDLAVLHHPFPLNDFGAGIGLPHRTPLIVHWHAEIVGRRVLSEFVAPIIRRTLARAQHIIVAHETLLANSPFVAAYRDKCAVIPHGIDVDYWSDLDASQLQKVEALRSRYPRLLITTGRLVAYKGHHILLEALRRLNATLVIVGDGPLSKQLRRAAKQFGLRDSIFLAGALSRDDLKVYLHAARVYAFPSVSAAEAFGISQIEAMAVGLPIVNTDLPTGVPHVARNGLEALTVPPNDAAALASAIEQLLDDQQLARRLGAAGRARALAKYKLDRFVMQTEKFYESAMGQVCDSRDQRGASLEVFDELPRQARSNMARNATIDT
jgi:glycosyltransferase involved in cell wall biosynthesis